MPAQQKHELFTRPGKMETPKRGYLVYEPTDTDFPLLIIFFTSTVRAVRFEVTSVLFMNVEL